MKLINSSRAGNSERSIARLERVSNPFAVQAFLDLEALISYSAGDLLLLYVLSPHVHLVEMVCAS